MKKKSKGRTHLPTWERAIEAAEKVGDRFYKEAESHELEDKWRWQSKGDGAHAAAAAIKKMISQESWTRKDLSRMEDRMEKAQARRGRATILELAASLAEMSDVFLAKLER